MRESPGQIVWDPFQLVQSEDAVRLLGHLRTPACPLASPGYVSQLDWRPENAPPPSGGGVATSALNPAVLYPLLK